jgi:hypothetical protein
MPGRRHDRAFLGAVTALDYSNGTGVPHTSLFVLARYRRRDEWAVVSSQLECARHRRLLPDVEHVPHRTNPRPPLHGHRQIRTSAVVLSLLVGCEVSGDPDLLGINRVTTHDERGGCIV